MTLAIALITNEQQTTLIATWPRFDALAGWLTIRAARFAARLTFAIEEMWYGVLVWMAEPVTVTFRL